MNDFLSEHGFGVMFSTDMLIAIAPLALSIYGIAHLMLLLHELGHLLSAKAYGITVHGISLGIVPMFKYTTPKGFTVSLGLIPLAGYVDMELSASKFKNIVVSAAGPAVNAVCAAGGAYIFLHAESPSPLLAFFLFFNLFAFIENMLPIPGYDGGIILEELRRKESVAEPVVAMASQ